MNINEREVYQAMSIELLLNRKIEDFFHNDKYNLVIFQAYAAKNTKLKKQLEMIETLIPMIRESIAVGQLKRALKMLVTLDVLMNKLKSNL